MDNLTINLVHTGHYSLSKELCVGYGNPTIAFAYWAIYEWCNIYSGAEHKIYNHRIYSRVRLQDIHYLIPFCGERAVRDALKVLKDAEIIDIQNLNPDKRDHTLWYAIREVYS